MPPIVLKQNHSTKSTKMLKIKNATNSTSVPCNHLKTTTLAVEDGVEENDDNDKEFEVSTTVMYN